MITDITQKKQITQDHPLLIIGGGLAGFIAALHCEFLSIDYRIIAKKEINQSSYTAAGIYNPIVFKRMNLSWEADLLIPYLEHFFAKVEHLFGKTLLHKIDILRPIKEKDKAQFWQKRSLEETGKYSSPHLEKPLHHLEYSIATGRVSNSGWLDTSLFLKECYNYFENKIIGREEIKLEEIGYSFNSDLVVIKGESYSKVIFAEGYQASLNPLWSWLPWKLAKGEVLTVRFEDNILSDYITSLNTIVSKDMFILPVGDGKFRIGSNYEWEYDDNFPSEQAKNFILSKLFELTGRCELTILEHKSGIRPTVADRRPFLGSNPIYKNLFILNGFGSKGVMLAPYFANQLIGYIFGYDNIEPLADISRFPKRFKNLYDYHGVRFASL